MLGFLFRALAVTLCFFSATGSGFFSTGLLSEMLLESVKEISLNQPFVEYQVPIIGGRGKKEKEMSMHFASIHRKLHAKGSIG